MLIQVRGTSGSGKTTAVTQFMEMWEERHGGTFDPAYIKTRRKPLYYEWGGKDSVIPHYNIVVLGHYETVCGGGDTIGSTPDIWERIQRIKFTHLIVEGLVLSEDVIWLCNSEYKQDSKIFHLTTPVEECIERTRRRRIKKGQDPEFNKMKLESRSRAIWRCRERLLKEGVHCPKCSSRQAAKLIMRTIENADGSNLVE